MNAKREITLLNEKTRKNYAREITKFNENFYVFAGKNPEDATEQEILNYMDECHPKFVVTLPLLNIHIAAIKNWYFEKTGEKLYAGSHPQVQNTDIRILDRETLEQLFEHTRSHVCGNMIRFIFATGVRLDEIVKIRVSDVNFEELGLQLRNRDDKPAHFTVFPEAMKNELYRLANGKDEDEFLFSIRTAGNGKNLPVAKRTLQSYLSKAVIQLNLGKITAQTLRDNFALQLLQNGVNARAVGQLMGFSSSNAILRFKKFLAGRPLKVSSPF